MARSVQERRIGPVAVAGGALILVVLALLFLRLRPGPGGTRAHATNAQLREVAVRLAALERQEAEIARLVWAPELLAQECAQAFDRVWDDLKAASNKFDVLAGFAAQQWTLAKYDSPCPVAAGIQWRSPTADRVVLDADGWRRQLRQWEAAGWAIGAVEFRHHRFDTNRAGAPDQSLFYVAAQLVNPVLSLRAALEGDLRVAWGPGRSSEGFQAIRDLDATGLVLTLRAGKPAFEPILTEEIAPPPGSHFIDPLILQDLDGDGLSEIILASSNLAYRRQPDGRYRATPLYRHSPGLIFTAVMADFDQDGQPDLLCAVFAGLVLLKGAPRGEFNEPGRLVWAAQPHLKYGQVLTCADVDGDGDLDVWLGQYKNPYERGQMPCPYYDAKDGNPAYLLLNDGRGNFTDSTEQAGLGAKRWRRSYSGSLADLNGDGSPDLLVVSDFAGLDVYRNDGHGRFTDVTQAWLGESHMFGMGHAFADFDLDGRMDLLAMGMHCPTAQRLDRLGLKRPGHPDYEEMRPLMTRGNRLFLGRGEGRFGAGSLGDSIAHSGWSWSCAAFDCDNDGYPDVYVANGHETRQSVREYEPEFWLHDIYVGNSAEDLLKSFYFGAQMGRTRGRGYSYGGNERNRLFLNQQGNRFVEAGHLLGVGLSQDCRNAAADDLDGDGRMDLIVTTFEVWPQVKQTLRVFRNRLDPTGNWIGFRLGGKGRDFPPIGAQVTLRYGGKTTVKQAVTGDSHRTQHASAVHCGLGTCPNVERAEIRWGNGRQSVLDHPRVNTWHSP